MKPLNRDAGRSSERAMKKAGLVSLVAFGLALLVASGAGALDTGARAPELGVRDLEGNNLTMASLRGRVVVVDFWASWCAPCADSMPVYQRLYETYRERGLTVVGISQDQRVDNARQFARRYHLSFPVLFDESHAIANRFRPPRMPTAYVIDRQGIVRHVHDGYRDGDGARLEREVQALLGAR